VTGAPGDTSRLFVVQRTGQIMVLRNGRKQAQPFLGVAKLINTSFDEQGLLGLAFSPGYARNGLFHVYYTLPDNDIRVAQYSRSKGNAGLADPSSARTVLSIDHHQFQNHDGGQLAFGPDGDLYIGVGDGGSEGDPNRNGQNTDTLLAKILRIAPSPKGGYAIPAGNPYAGRSGKRPEIWAYGLRNPWRFSFDRTTGALIVGDVGQDLQEEIDYTPKGTGAGANYGWSVWEGDNHYRSASAPRAVSPVLVAKHSDGYCAIVGGYVVRDASLPALNGRYLFGDNCRPQIEAVTLSAGHATGLRATGLKVTATSSFGQDTAGHIYVASLNGPVYRLAAQ
jgi:glucose/arabinose dehydrogenase